MTSGTGEVMDVSIDTKGKEKRVYTADMGNTPSDAPDDRPQAIAGLKKLRGMSEDEITKYLGISESESAALFRQAALLQEQEDTPTAPVAAQAALPKSTGLKQAREDAAVLALNLKDAYRLLASFVETAHHASVALDSYLNDDRIGAQTVKDLAICLNDISRHYFMTPGEMSNPEWIAKTRRLFETLGGVDRGENYDREYFKGNHEDLVRALARSVEPPKRVPRG